MRKARKAIAILTLIAFAVFIFAPSVLDTSAFAAPVKPRVWDELTQDGQLKDSATEAEYVVLMDAKTGEVLYQKNANEQKFPASITKIMTCLLVLENVEDLDEKVTVANFTIDDPKASVIGIMPGEEISVHELLYGLMLPSGNDAAAALAIHVAGSIANFAQMMNARAAEIGMTNTHFVNPHGLHDDNHYTTAMDMAKLAFVAMQNDAFREIVSTPSYIPAPTNIHNADNNWNPDMWENTNKLVSGSYEEPYAFNDSTKGHAIGIKTGYTSKAKYTLVSAAQNTDGTQEVIAVVLSSGLNERFVDSTTMFLYAFEFYDTLDVMDFLSGEMPQKIHVDNALDTQDYANLDVYVEPVEPAYITDIPSAIEAIKSQPGRFTKVETFNENLTAPIAMDQQVGTVEFYFDGGQEPILTCNILAAEDVEAMPEATPTPTPSPTMAPTPTPAPTGLQNLTGYAGYILIGLALLILVIVIIAVVVRRSKPKPRRSSSSGPRDRRPERRYDPRFKDGVQRGRGRRR